MSDIRISYWDENGKYQNEYKRLYDANVPASGESETIEGELIRAISRLFHEYCHNGNLNAAEHEDDTIKEICWECGGTGEDDDGDTCWECGGDGYIMEDIQGELKIDDFYNDFLELIEKNVPESSNLVSGVYGLIVNESLHYKYKYTQEEMDVYNRLCDKVIEHVLEKEKTGFSPLR